MILRYQYTDHPDCWDVWVRTPTGVEYFRTRRDYEHLISPEQHRANEEIAELALHEAIVLGE